MAFGLNAGEVFTRLGLRTDDSSFEHGERRIGKLRSEARRDIHQGLKLHVDDQGFRKARGHVTGLERDGSRLEKTGHRLGSALGGAAKVGALGAAAGFGALAVAGKQAYDAFAESNQVNAQTVAVLKSTKGAAGETKKEISDLATQISRYSGMDDEAVQAGENLLLTFTNVRNEAGKGNDVFTQSTKIMADMSTALGEDTSSAAIQLGKALNDPIKGVTALQRVGVSFTKDQKDQIKTLVEHGHRLEAQKMILGELTKEFGGSAKAAGETLPGALHKAETELGNLGEEIGGKVAPKVKVLTDRFVGFVRGMVDNTGAGGRFVDRLKADFERAKDFVRPLTTALRGIWSDSDTSLGEKIGRSVQAATPFIANAAGRVFFAVGPRAAQSFVTGFLHAGPMGQLFALGWLGSKIGAFSALGRLAASKFSGALGKSLKFAGVIGGALALIGAIASLGGHTKSTADASRDLASALDEERDAMRQVRDVDLDLTADRVQARASALGVKEAERELARVRKQTPHDLLAIKEAENNVAQARVQSKRDARALHDAEQDANGIRQKGIAATQKATKAAQDNVAAIQASIDTDRAKIKAYARINEQQGLTAASQRDLDGATKDLTKRQKELNTALGQLAVNKANQIVASMIGPLDRVRQSAQQAKQALIELNNMPRQAPVPSSGAGGFGGRNGAQGGRFAGGGMFVTGDRNARGTDNRFIVGPNGIEAAVAPGELLVFQGEQQSYLDRILPGGIDGFFGLSGWKPHSNTPRFAKGGGLKASRTQATLGKKAAAGAPGLGSWADRISNLERDYGQLDRKYGQSDEVFIVEDAHGAHIDKKAVKHRTDELDKLAALRRKIRKTIREYRDAVSEAIKAYKHAIERMAAALAALKGRKGKKITKARAGYSQLLSDYQQRHSELVGTRRDLGQDIQDSTLDLGDLGDERKALSPKSLASQLPAPETPTPLGPDDQPSAPEPGTTAPSASDIAAAAFAQYQSFQAGRADLFRGFGANFVAAGQLGGAFGDPTKQAAGMRYFGALGGEGGSGGDTTINVTNNFGGGPADELTFAQRTAGELRAALR